jgi:hypothetical protein
MLFHRRMFHRSPEYKKSTDSNKTKKQSEYIGSISTRDKKIRDSEMAEYLKAQEALSKISKLTANIRR